VANAIVKSDCPRPRSKKPSVCSTFSFPDKITAVPVLAPSFVKYVGSLVVPLALNWTVPPMLP
jgi:hypothetical protein